MKHVERQLRYRIHHTSLFAHVGGISMLIAFALLWSGESARWLLATLVGSYVLLAGISVGMHRLFCHRAFVTSRAWEWFLAVAGTLAVLGSPAQWSSTHKAHHKHSDTSSDPHFTGWSYLLWRRYNRVTLDVNGQMPMLRDPMHRFLHTYNMAIVLGLCFALWLVDYRALLFGYLVPLGIVHTVGGLHQVISHANGKPRDLPWMEFLLPPILGEWYHKSHHDHPRSARFGRFDLGHLIVKLIQKQRMSIN